MRRLESQLSPMSQGVVTTTLSGIGLSRQQDENRRSNDIVEDVYNSFVYSTSKLIIMNTKETVCLCNIKETPQIPKCPFPLLSKSTNEQRSHHVQKLSHLDDVQ